MKLNHGGEAQPSKEEERHRLDFGSSHYHLHAQTSAEAGETPPRSSEAVTKAARSALVCIFANSVN